MTLVVSVLVFRMNIGFKESKEMVKVAVEKLDFVGHEFSFFKQILVPHEVELL